MRIGDKVNKNGKIPDSGTVKETPDRPGKKTFWGGGEKDRLLLPAWALLAAGLLALFALNLFFGDHWLDSDMSAEMVFSGLLAEKGEFVATTGWYYSTEFRVLYTQLLMEPLFFLFKDWSVIRLITNMLTYGLLLCSYLYMVKPLGIRKSTGIFTSVLLLVPFSETFITHVQFGNTYMFHMLLIFFVFGMFLRLSEKQFQPGSRRFVLAGCYVLLSIVCGLSGVRYLLALQAPLVLTAAVYVMKSRETGALRREPSWEQAGRVFAGERLRYLGFSLLGAVSALAGYGLNVAMIARKYDFQTYEATNFIGVYQGIFLERLQDTFGSLLMLFGYIPDKGFLSLRGLISLIAFALMAGMVLLIVRSGRLLKAEGDKKGEFAHRRFLLWFFVTAFALNTFVFVFTTGTLVPRYYLTVIMFAVPLLAVYFEEERLPLDRWLVIALLSGCLLLATAKTVFSFVSTDKNAEKRPVAAFLEDQGYEFGYATYWNANIITELTDGRVEVANVDSIEELSFFLWSSPKKYYQEGYYEGSPFLLLTAREAAENASTPVITAGRRVYEDGSYVVIAYESVEELMKYRVEARE